MRTNSQRDPVSFDKSTERILSNNLNHTASQQIYSNPCEDTFLEDTDPKYVDSQLLIKCEPHQLQAVFFSNQQQKYKCFKCLLQEQDLIYIDKKFKKEMEEYERIKQLASEAIQNNIPKMNGMKQWKNSIRTIIMDVRSMFQRWVDTFSNQLIASLKDIENSKDLKEFNGEDRRLNLQLESLRDKYVQIMKVFTLISNTSAEQKPKVIDQHKNKIMALEKEIKKQDALIVMQSAKMKEAQTKTVAIDGLQFKLGQKYIAHFEKKLNHRNKSNVKQGNESIASINQTGFISKINDGAQSTRNINTQQQISSSKSNHSLAKTEFHSSQQTQQMPQIEKSNRQGTIQSNNTYQQSAITQNKQSSGGLSQQITTQKISDVQSQKTQQSKNTQQSQPKVQVSSYVKGQTQISNLQDTLNLDFSEIRQPSHGHIGTQGYDPTLSLIPEMMEFSSTQKTMQQQPNKTKQYEEEKGNIRNTNVSNSLANQSSSNYIDQSSISYRYRHKNQNSIYYLKPRSNEIYLLDFKLQKFVKEQIKSLTLIPTGFSSVQITNGNIYLLGGQSQDKQISKSCWEIDPNMNMIEKASMKIGRYNFAIALLFDKFIFAIGGNIQKGSQTDQVECYDTTINTWYPVGSLQKARSFTTACVLAQRYIYVFPGQQSNTWSTIEFLDIGHSIDPKELKKAKWNLVNIQNPDFNVTFAYGSAQISQTEILVFGGSKNNCFLLDTNVIQNLLKAKKDLSKQSNDSQKILTTMNGSPLCMDAWFGYESDFMARIYGNYLYALDQHAGNLHVFSIKDKQWNYSTLKDLGIN